MIFDSEKKFEDAVVEELSKNGWDEQIIEYPTEDFLIDNWANILFENNQEIDKLNGCPLTKGEMQQILAKISELRHPVMLNKFINGGSVPIIRDNQDDKLHFNKEVFLKIYDRNEIAGGDSRYQIVRQPQFKSKNKILQDRRGDLMLLINGMPVFHIELKKSNVHVSEAYNQIEKYSFENVFTGLFSLVQVFVAMTPDETVYFANPGTGEIFNKDFYFHWCDFYNEPVNNWKDVIGSANSLLSIPMAHQLIGFYTIADDTDGKLKVMRSYQYHAASRISDKVSKSKWTKDDSLGGYIWHTTGSGKTLTSFKSAQLISNSDDADKVVFLMDRIELGTQSLNEYRGFADDSETVQETENTTILVNKLKSDKTSDMLIVTSIQKMSNIVEDDELKNYKQDIKKINEKRIVIIVDECHRSTFGKMLSSIKKTFPTAMFFGFTGTPIHEENMKNKNTTTDVFGNELHRYSIADGIRDQNVLGFDVAMITSDATKMRKQVALRQANASNEQELINDPAKQAVYLEFMDEHKHPMAGVVDGYGNYTKGIEDYYPKSQYTHNPEYQRIVVNEVIKNFPTLSRFRKFHAIFATSSISEAIEYYGLFKQSDLNIAALFDPSIDNNEYAITKEQALLEIINDYNELFNQNFRIATYQTMKKDISDRLAHKGQYIALDKHKDKQIDILIVVDQMLTGFDSKWVNTLYLDKRIRHESIIQAFSRTNRLFNKHEKPFGIVRYFRYPFTMKKAIDRALALYSGNKPYGVFVEKLDKNLNKINEHYLEIKDLFQFAGIEDFHTLPNDMFQVAKFAKEFNLLNEYINAATVQGFTWDKKEYEFDSKDTIIVEITLEIYQTLLQRYKEIASFGSNNDTAGVPLEIDSYITQMESQRIDSYYMNSRFEKFKNALVDENKEAIDRIAQELHKSFAGLPKKDQDYANQLLHGIQSGSINVTKYDTVYDYINEQKLGAFNSKIDYYVSAFGVDKDLLVNLCELDLTESTLDEYGRFQKLKDTVDLEKAKEYLENKDNKSYKNYQVNMKVDSELRFFILNLEE